MYSVCMHGSRVTARWQRLRGRPDESGIFFRFGWSVGVAEQREAAVADSCALMRATAKGAFVSTERALTIAQIERE